MQAQAGPSRPVLTCAAALLTALLALAIVPAGARAAGAEPAHRHITRTAVVLATVVADPGHATVRADHHAVLSGPPRPAGTGVAGPASADSSRTANPATAWTPPARGPPTQARA